MRPFHLEVGVAARQAHGHVRDQRVEEPLPVQRVDAGAHRESTSSDSTATNSDTWTMVCGTRTCTAEPRSRGTVVRRPGQDSSATTTARRHRRAPCDDAERREEREQPGGEEHHLNVAWDTTITATDVDLFVPATAVRTGWCAVAGLPSGVPASSSGRVRLCSARSSRRARTSSRIVVTAIRWPRRRRDPIVSLARAAGASSGAVNCHSSSPVKYHHAPSIICAAAAARLINVPSARQAAPRQRKRNAHNAIRAGTRGTSARSPTTATISEPERAPAAAIPEASAGRERQSRTRTAPSPAAPLNCRPASPSRCAGPNEADTARTAPRSAAQCQHAQPGHVASKSGSPSVSSGQHHRQAISPHRRR